MVSARRVREIIRSTAASQAGGVGRVGQFVRPPCNALMAINTRARLWAIAWTVLPSNAKQAARQIAVGECECGPDGCGGQCSPGCSAGFSCDTPTGQCKSTCTPNCGGKQCGPDGCGGQCSPGCSAGFSCDTPTGQCKSTCTPNCGGKQCGPDGCGGSCGACPSGQVCTDGQCEMCSGNFPVYCSELGGGCWQSGTICSTAAQCPDGNQYACTTAGYNVDCTTQQCKSTCTPNCGGKQCGPDGCGGRCSPGCGSGETCQGGSCQPICKPTCDPDRCGGDGCGHRCACPSGKRCDLVNRCVSCFPANAGCQATTDCCPGLICVAESENGSGYCRDCLVDGTACEPGGKPCCGSSACVVDGVGLRPICSPTGTHCQAEGEGCGQNSHCCVGGCSPKRGVCYAGCIPDGSRPLDGNGCLGDQVCCSGRCDDTSSGTGSCVATGSIAGGACSVDSDCGEWLFCDYKTMVCVPGSPY
jgi:hypothetical protein